MRSRIVLSVSFVSCQSVKGVHLSSPSPIPSLPMIHATSFVYVTRVVEIFIGYVSNGLFFHCLFRQGFQWYFQHLILSVLCLRSVCRLSQNGFSCSVLSLLLYLLFLSNSCFCAVTVGVKEPCWRPRDSLTHTCLRLIKPVFPSIKKTNS